MTKFGDNSLILVDNLGFVSHISGQKIEEMLNTLKCRNNELLDFKLLQIGQKVEF
jgi:hypothetical protein